MSRRKIEITAAQKVAASLGGNPDELLFIELFDGADVYYRFGAKIICRGNRVMMLLRYFGNKKCTLFVSEPRVYNQVLSLTMLDIGDRNYAKQRIIDLYKKYIACQVGDTETSVMYHDMSICGDYFMKFIAKKYGLSNENTCYT